MYTLFENYIMDDAGNSIPMDLNNRHYRKYLTWVEAGNTPVNEVLLKEYQNELCDIKQETAAVILNTYPVYKQLNIIMNVLRKILSDKELVDMVDFINAARLEGNTKEANLDAPT